MSAGPNSNKKTIPFIKMNGAGNDFVIFDARQNEIFLDAAKIKKIADRQSKHRGCDQVIVIKHSPTFDCEMEIYNSDGSLSGACGNATRCVAGMLFEEKKLSEVKIKTIAGVLKAWPQGNLVAVNMGTPSFDWKQIPLSKPMEKIRLHDLEFYVVNVGNPHAVTFVDSALSDKNFAAIGRSVEVDPLFPQKINVEFAKIISDDLIEVRVWERGAGETKACGSGACAVAVLAMKENLIKSRKVTIRFEGGDLIVEWKKDFSIVMTGGYEKEFDGKVEV